MGLVVTVAVAIAVAVTGFCLRSEENETGQGGGGKKDLLEHRGNLQLVTLTASDWA